MDRRLACRIPAVVAALSVAVLFARGSAYAAAKTEHRTLLLNAGESRVIDHVQPGSAPDIHVLDNPQALVVHTEAPGEIVLLAAERGRWEVRIALDTGEIVDYDVRIVGAAEPGAPLKPGSIAQAMEPSSSADAVAPTAPLDAGAGPISRNSAAPASAPHYTETTWAAPAGAPAPASPLGGAMNGAAPQSANGTLQAPVERSQGTSVIQPAKKFRTDPSVAASGGNLATASVSGGFHYLPADGISMMTGTSRIIDFHHRLKRISIADTDVADVQVINPYELNLIAHKAGFTTLAVWNEQGHYEERQVRIDPSGKQQVMLNTIVAELDINNLENQGMNYSAALANYGVSLVGLPGAVATPFSQQTTTTGTSTASSTVLPAGGAIMPLLLSQNLTYGLAAQNSNVLTQTFFQFLESHNLGRILAEPQLLANSGEKAKFLDGGEIPIVVAQALNTSVVFKQYGTSVVFVPTVVGVNDVELLVKPEVSQPNYAQGVQLFGFTVPAFVTRRAETMVRLRDDQTLIIAGLILDQKNETIQKVPYLGDVPYLGGLFRNTAWTDTKTDLMIAVTPQIVRPLPPGAQVFKPSSRGHLTYNEVETKQLSRPDPGRPRF